MNSLFSTALLSVLCLGLSHQVHAQAQATATTKPKSEKRTAEAKEEGTLTTNHGLPVADNQNQLKAGVRGPVLLEDFIFREKMQHFDHERIPERIVHARGSGAHGYFQCYESQADITKAAFLQDPAKKTEVFVRFSTVAGERGSADLARDVRGFAVKFYTKEGNYDLVGNNIPVFFIQDAMKFPDLVHAVKPEPHNGIPQAASAHDTFWDFASLMPEINHMLMWVMSDRALPRSYRMMEGFGVHTFRLINAKGVASFVKFHWRPKLGVQSVLWDEATKINGKDPDFHRKDLWEAIERGDFPEYELGLQVIDDATAAKLEFDLLDPTKLVPEEIVPLRIVGKLVLNRNPDNFFAETEQIAFLPTNLVPGIEFTNDPLLQGRLFSYQDTQLSRLGGPNFHQLPINQPKGCPMGFGTNFQRDGMHQTMVPKGRVAYEPNSLDGGKGPRENPAQGFISAPEEMTGPKVRKRSETFGDHYSQARLFFRSQNETEQRHIINAFTFELSKVQSKEVRVRMLAHLAQVDATLHSGVAAGLGMKETSETLKPAVPAHDLPPSPSLSILGKAPKILAGRKIGVLVADGFNAAALAALRKSAAAEKAVLAVISPKVGGAKDGEEKVVQADMALSGAPSVLFDAVVILSSKESSDQLAADKTAVDWVSDAFSHCKVLGYSPDARPLLDAAGVKADEGTIEVGQETGDFIQAAKNGRIWGREPAVRPRG
ncbi:catalase [Brevifollis gellanilyticus]|uniref:Catalase n=1 Tax=Brevifollis gellanilyticus TaxID=748831 RepID=A0A512M2I0_9BACT|nr:catalase [Brevifollis gellanilyticus]GEP40940.1 catalase [Brevifollis gellanilyticus]